MNAVNQKHNEKDNEMVQLTKIILKQTARHTRHVKRCIQNTFQNMIFTLAKNCSLFKNSV